jgi:hypothetical protein
MLQFGASLTDATRSVNYDLNMFIIQATGTYRIEGHRPSSQALDQALPRTNTLAIGTFVSNKEDKVL